ncbi:hypothetical protein VC218_12445 [Xanthomonas nasturtii]|nr:hypothetical protein [Xanthomonas nasturtii]MEA9579681.1 hypothetical protein [Xanthomonas nasturtii]
MAQLAQQAGREDVTAGAAIVAVQRNLLMWDEGRRVRARHAIA